MRQTEDRIGHQVPKLHGANGSENLRATDQSIDRRIGYWSNGYDLRSPPGIASTDETVLVTWSDSSLAEGAQVQDVFTSVVQLGELPSDGKAGGALPPRAWEVWLRVD